MERDEEREGERGWETNRGGGREADGRKREEVEREMEMETEKERDQMELSACLYGVKECFSSPRRQELN